MGFITLFKTILLVQLFYAAAITLMLQTMPADSIVYVDSFSDLADDLDFQSVSSDVQESLQRQTNIPVIDIGALVFYSGNILIDLVLNFTFAIPEMIGLLVNGLLFLFNVPSIVVVTVQAFASVAIIILYFMGIIQLLMTIRSGRTVA